MLPDDVMSRLVKVEQKLIELVHLPLEMATLKEKYENVREDVQTIIKTQEETRRERQEQYDNLIRLFHESRTHFDAKLAETVKEQIKPLAEGQIQYNSYMKAAGIIGGAILSVITVIVAIIAVLP